MSTTAEHIATKNDADLISRLTAQAEMMGIAEAASWVNSNVIQLIQAPVTEASDTITSVRAYADAVRAAYVAATPPAPGLNPAAVTDAHLAAAITAVKTATP